MPLGWTNPLPMALGGGPTDIENMWRAMRAMMGGEHGPGPEGGIDDLARQQKATSLAGAERAIERALLQTFPALATDALPIWEELLLASGADTTVTLRELLVLAWLPPDGATTPHLTADLTTISAQLTIQIEDVDDVHTTIAGKYQAPNDDIPSFGTTSPPGISAVLPMFATRDILRAVYTLEAGETEIPAVAADDVTRLLSRRLPAWQTWTLVQLDDDDGAGFFLDGGANGNSLLDVTAFG